MRNQPGTGLEKGPGAGGGCLGAQNNPALAACCFFGGCDLSEGGVAAPAAGGCSSPSSQDEWRPPRLGHGSKPWKFAIRGGCLDGCRLLTALPSKNPAASQSWRSPRPQLLRLGLNTASLSVCLPLMGETPGGFTHQDGAGSPPQSLRSPQPRTGAATEELGLGRVCVPRGAAE